MIAYVQIGISPGSPLALRRRFYKRGLVADAVDQLARAMAGGLNLSWEDLPEDSRSELRSLAGEVVQRLGRAPA